MHITDLSLWPIDKPINYSELILTLKGKKFFEEKFNKRTLYFICSKCPAKFTKIKKRSESVYIVNFCSSSVKGVVEIEVSKFLRFKEVKIQDGQICCFSDEQTFVLIKVEDLGFIAKFPELRHMSIVKKDDNLDKVLSFTALYIGIASKGIIKRFEDGHRGLMYAAEKRSEHNELYIIPLFLRQDYSFFSNFDFPDDVIFDDKDNHIDRSILATNWNDEDKFLWSIEQALIDKFGRDHIDDGTNYSFPTPKNLIKRDSITYINLSLKSKYLSIKTPKFSLCSEK